MRNLLNFYVALATFVLLGGSALAQTATIDGVIYTVYGDSVHVTGNDGSVTEVNIPATVTINSVEYPVRVIGNQAFMNSINITTVAIAKGIKSIENHAFAYCSSLELIYIPEGVISIGNGAFYQCVNLKTITIPEGVTSINNQTFEYCSSLKSITIPKGVVNIGDHAFSCCSSLTSIFIPEGVISIGMYAFYNCSSINSIEIPLGVKNIYDNAFQYCSSLFEVIFNVGLETIGVRAFEGCLLLENVVLPEGLKSLSSGVFDGCSSLYSLELPSTINDISSYLPIPTSLSKLVCKGTTPPSGAPPYETVVFVPEGCYEVYNEAWPIRAIVEGDGVGVDVNITTPGTLGLEILKQVDYLKDVNYLKVSGVLNSDDFEIIRGGSMPNLIEIDYSGLKIESISSNTLPSPQRYINIVLPESLKAVEPNTFTSPNLRDIVIPEGVALIGDEAFRKCLMLKDVSLPSTLTNIGNHCFHNCANLENITLPEGLASLGYYAFGDTKIREIVIPDGIHIINERAFSECVHLESVILSDNLEEICNYAFCDCAKLKSIMFPKSLNKIGVEAFCRTGLERVILPEGLQELGKGVFAGSSNIIDITMPSTLHKCGDAIFNICSSLQSVTCLSIVPPSVTSSLLDSNNTLTLYVPSFSLGVYKMSVGWNNFYKIEPLKGVVSETISIYDEQMLDLSTENLIASGAPLDYKPDVYIHSIYEDANTYSAGKLKTVGTVTSAQASMSIGKFEMDQTRSTKTMTSFINMLESDSEMNADSVVTNLEVSTGGWHFLSFPYDVKISDISTMGDWVIRRYDGAARANGDYSNTWVTVPYEETLNAGEGYIWTTTNGNFRIPAVDNENKNNLFANSTQYVPLREFASTTIADNSWNLIGNPFPCYYDTRFLEYTAPITVRSGSSYSAYSPVDDSYILMPLEAFFVQKPSNVESIGFTTDGRQTDNVARTLDAEAKIRTLKAAERKVFNISIEGMGSADRTRFVINESASSAYEMECDAAKFMSDDTSLPQIFTLENAERLAINERPMGNGEISLGAYFGTAGTYTLSLNTKCAHTVVLVDNFTGEETDLTAGTYTFEAEQGTFNERFTIRLWDDIVNSADDMIAENKVTVSAAGGIAVENATEDIYVYNAAGSLVDVKNGGNVTFALPQGIYVVKVGNDSFKVSVTR